MDDAMRGVLGGTRPRSSEGGGSVDDGQEDGSEELVEAHHCDETNQGQMLQRTQEESALVKKKKKTWILKQSNIAKEKKCAGESASRMGINKMSALCLARDGFGRGKSDQLVGKASSMGLRGWQP